MEAKRLLDVLDKQLALPPVCRGESYTGQRRGIWPNGSATWCWECL